MFTLISISYFLFLLSSLGGWGLLINRSLRLDSPIVVIPCATAFFSIIIGLLYTTSVPSPVVKKIIIIIFLICGSLVFLRNIRKLFQGNLNSFQTWFVIGISLISLPVVIMPNPFWDTTWYHLPAPLYWISQNSVIWNQNSLIQAQAAYWEYLYFYPILLFNTFTTDHLAQINIITQLLHFYCGFIISILFLFKIMTHYFSRNYFLLILGILLIFSDFPLQYSTITAKNDWGLASWWLAAFYLGFIKENKKLSAFLFGLVLAAKFSYIPICGVMILLLLKSMKKNDALITFVIFIIAPLSIFTRNFAWTGNPVFPFLNNFFNSSMLGPTWKLGLTAISEPTLSNLEKIINFSFKQYIVVFIGAIIAIICYKKLPKALILLFPLTFLFLATSGLNAELRLIAGPFSLVILSSLFIIYQFGQDYLKSWLLKILLIASLSINLYSMRFFDIPTIKIKDYWTNSYSTEEYLSSIHGLSQISWVKAHCQEKYLMLSDVKTYYYFPCPITRLWDSPELDSRITNQKDFYQIAKLLKKDGYRFMLDSLDLIDRFHDLNTTLLIASEIREHHQNAVVFVSPSGDWIVDIDKIVKNYEDQSKL